MPKCRRPNGPPTLTAQYTPRLSVSSASDTMASHKGGWLVSVIGDALLAVNYGRSGLGDCGLNGYLVDGKTMPESFEEQADVIWTHIGTLLQSAGMGFKTWCPCAPISPIPSTTRPTCACASSTWVTMRHPQPSYVANEYACGLVWR